MLLPFVIWCRTVWSIFVHNLVAIEQKIKKLWRSGGGGESNPPTYLTSKKPNPCRAKSQISIRKKTSKQQYNFYKAKIFLDVPDM